MYIDMVLQLLTHLQAANTSEYSLNGGLETAVRGCSARHEPDDTLGRLRVRLHRGGSLETGALTSCSRQGVNSPQPLRDAAPSHSHLRETAARGQRRAPS